MTFHAVHQRFELGLAVAINRDLRAQLILYLFELLGDDGVVGIQLRGNLVLGRGLLEASSSREPARACEVILRGAQLGALEAGTRVDVIGVALERAGELDDRDVVVLPFFRLARFTKRGTCHAPGQRRDDGQCGDRVFGRQSAEHAIGLRR